MKTGPFDILKFSLAVRLRGHKQRKLNAHVYSFLLLCPPGLAIKLNFNISKVIYCLSQKLNCHFSYGDDRPEAKKRKKKMGGFCSAEASEMGTIPVFSVVLWAFQKGRFRSFSRFGRWEKSTHFKEMAKELCLLFPTVNKLVLRGSERTID